jgi:hypothetical protein
MRSTCASKVARGCISSSRSANASPMYLHRRETRCHSMGNSLLGQNARGCPVRQLPWARSFHTHTGVLCMLTQRSEVLRPHGQRVGVGMIARNKVSAKALGFCRLPHSVKSTGVARRSATSCAAAS